MRDRNVQDSPQKIAKSSHYHSSSNCYHHKLQEFPGLVYADDATESYRGSWRKQFQAPNRYDAPLYVEIGCNAGHVILPWAQTHTNHLYVGLDWKFKSIFRAAEKASQKGLSNLLFLRAHARHLDSIFAPSEISGFFVFFPDPWSKRAQQKNRLMTPQYLETLASLLQPQGILHIKTDHAAYFESIVKMIDPLTWTILEHSNDLHANHPQPETLQIPEVTLFERLFIQKKIPIQNLKLMKT
jgi:tRNA (guanine-N7-)-methyltransferase